VRKAELKTNHTPDCTAANPEELSTESPRNAAGPHFVMYVNTFGNEGYFTTTDTVRVLLFTANTVLRINIIHTLSLTA